MAPLNPYSERVTPIGAPVPSPGGRVQPRPSGVVASQGGRVQPSAPKQTTPKLSATQIATQNAMSAFHTALAQLQSAIPQTDTTAIYAPYRQSEAVAGQLGTGLQSSIQQAGQAASQQYGQGLDTAQQHAAQFGIAAGGQPQALTNTGTPALATQTNAYAAAAPAAAAAWQALLERTGAAAVNTANQNRANTIASGTATLAGNIPQAIQNEETKQFQQKAEKFNEGLAQSQLTAKQVADLRSYELGAAKITQTGQQDATKNGLTAASLAERTRHDKATERGATIRAQKAAQSGVKGIPQVLAALKISTPSSSSSKRAAKGWDVTIQPWDTANNKPSGPVKTIHAARADFAPPGYKNVGATTHYESVPASTTTSSGMTRAQWDRAVGIYATYNGVSKSAAFKAVQQITPRPPK